MIDPFRIFSPENILGSFVKFSRPVQAVLIELV